jgi:hypothetical protein
LEEGGVSGIHRQMRGDWVLLLLGFIAAGVFSLNVMGFLFMREKDRERAHRRRH